MPRERAEIKLVEYDKLISGASPMPVIIAQSAHGGKLIIVTLLAGLAAVLYFTGTFDTSSTPSPPPGPASLGAGQAAASMQISVLPDVEEEDRRRSLPFDLLGEVHGHLRRAYDTAGTDYDAYRPPEVVDVPGAEILSTVNMIICFISSTGMFVVQPTSAPYQALVDMTPCQTGKRSDDQEIYTVTAYNTAASSLGTGTTYSGNAAFIMSGNETELKAEAAITVHTVPVADVCPGMKMPVVAGSATKTCWTGGMKWQESSAMSGYFDASYDASDADFPVSLLFYESQEDDFEGHSGRLILKTDTSGLNVRAKMAMQREGSPTVFCMNSNSTHARMSKGTTEENACATDATGGICLSRGDKRKYPFAFRTYDADTGALVRPEGVTSLNLEYTMGSRRCFAGVSPGGSFASCGHGGAGASDIFADGTEATDFSSNTYTLHHSNAKIEKFVVTSQNITEFVGGNYISYFSYDNNASKFFNYILTHDGSSDTILPVVYKRYDTGMGRWGNFTAGGGETVTLHSADVQFQPCVTAADHYVGEKKPGDGNWWGFTQGNGQYTYDTALAKVFYARSDGIAASTDDINLVCPALCQRFDDWTGTCHEYMRCPKTVFAGATLGHCDGPDCTSFNYTEDRAYRYVFNSTTNKIDALQDNAGEETEPTEIDATTGVNYDPMDWQQTTRSFMYVGENSTDFDTAEKLALYHKTPGAVYYRVGLGATGSHDGWSFYAKDDQGDAVVLAEPISCKVTMSTQTDANGGSAYLGASYDLTFFSGHTEGLKFEQMDNGNDDVGKRQNWIASPQIADGTLCVGESGNYRLKAEFVSVVPQEADGPCDEWDSIASPGTLPSATIAPNNAATDTPTTTKMCVSLRELINATVCDYYENATGTN